MDDKNEDKVAKRISLAAEELIKATYQQTEASSIVVQRDMATTIAALQKESVELKIDVQKLQKQNQQSTASMLQAMTTLNETIKEEAMKSRVQNLGFDTDNILHECCSDHGVCYLDEVENFKGDTVKLNDICSYLSLLTGSQTTFKYEKDDDVECWVVGPNSKQNEDGFFSNTNNETGTVAADIAIVPTKTHLGNALVKEDEEVINESGLDEKDVELVMSELGCSPSKAVELLKTNNGALVNFIMQQPISFD